MVYLGHLTALQDTPTESGQSSRGLPALFARDLGRDLERRQKALGLEEFRLQTRPEMALDQIRRLAKQAVSCAPVLADDAYGNDNA